MTPININPSINLLSLRERHVLSLVSTGHSSLRIAKQLGIAVRTVEKHRSHIIKKLNIDKTPNSLTRWAATHQLALKKFERLK